MSWYHKHKRNFAAAMGVCVAVGSIAGFTGCGKEAVSSSKSDENGKRLQKKKQWGDTWRRSLLFRKGVRRL